MVEENQQKTIHNFIRGLSSQEEENRLYEECRKRPELWSEIKRAIDNYNPVAEPAMHVEEKWKVFEAKLLKQNDTRISPYFSQMIKYAAVIIVTLISYTLLRTSIGYNDRKEEVVAFETYVPKGHQSEVRLPDGTLVRLNADSHLKYYSDFEKNRKVWLDGEAFFDVAHQLERSFRVETDFYTTKVLGTKFNLMAYSNMPYIKTTLESGSVSIEKEDGDSMKELTILEPGDEFIFDVTSESYQVQRINVANAISWQSNVLTFENVTLQEITRQLERRFDVNILITDTTLCQIKYRGKFKNNESLNEVLDVISVTAEIKYKNNRGNIKISKI